MNSRESPSRPGVRFPPPFLFAAGLLLGWVLETRVERIRLIGSSASPAGLQGVGALFLVGGLALSFSGTLTFLRARTAIIPNRPASRLVVSGPYRFTRNPMYTGLTAAYVGVALLANAGWPLLLLPLVVTALYWLVIRREERYLTHAFGEEYAAYQRRVRRWL